VKFGACSIKVLLRFAAVIFSCSNSVLFSVACLLTVSISLIVPTTIVAETIPESLAEFNTSEFDHSVTGFILDGNHSLLDCENCHVGGVFEELPRECSQCHDNVFAIGVNSTHIPVIEPCDTCHSTLGFEGSAMTTLMDHSILAGQPCSSCHDGITATGKSPTHLTTTLECDACHNTNNWLVSAFDHSNVIGQPCVSCHNGVDATGKHSGHISTTDICDACHLTAA